MGTDSGASSTGLSAPYFPQYTQMSSARVCRCRVAWRVRRRMLTVMMIISRSCPRDSATGNQDRRPCAPAVAQPREWPQPSLRPGLAREFQTRTG